MQKTILESILDLNKELVFNIWNYPIHIAKVKNTVINDKIKMLKSWHYNYQDELLQTSFEDVATSIDKLDEALNQVNDEIKDGGGITTIYVPKYHPLVNQLPGKELGEWIKIDFKSEEQE